MTPTAAKQPNGANKCGAAQRRADGPGREEFTAWLIASCQRQGVPVTITDSTTLGAVATLLHHDRHSGAQQPPPAR